MRWQRGQDDRNLEDRRGEARSRVRLGGGGMKIGLGGALVLVVLSLLFKKNFFALLDTGPMASTSETAGAPGPAGPVESNPQEEELKDFMLFVLNDSQATWTRLLPGQGTSYREAKLVLFRDAVDSACGFAESATGPFYCPGDEKVYLDLGFFGELHRRFGAPGDFAQAYVIAHEIGHHVQNVLGIERQVRQLQQEREEVANELSVRMELQADCFAGVWGSFAAKSGHLETGDVEEGLNAAAAIGDDRIQRMSGRGVSPESFTHGSSEQRVAWFRRGLESGNPAVCDTFGKRSR